MTQTTFAVLIPAIPPQDRNVVPSKAQATKKPTISPEEREQKKLERERKIQERQRNKMARQNLREQNGRGMFTYHN